MQFEKLREKINNLKINSFKRPLLFWVLLVLILSFTSAVFYVKLPDQLLIGFLKSINTRISEGSCYNLDGNTCSQRKDCYWVESGGSLGQFDEGSSPCKKIEDKSRINRTDYCSLNNDCPSDKCVKYFPCIDGSYNLSWGFSCSEYARYPDDCRYKDFKQKEQYQEISLTEAKKCLTDFTQTNEIEYPLLKYLEVNEMHPQYTAKFQTCSDPEIGLSNSEVDTYCLLLPLIRSSGSNKVLPSEDIKVVVGAQTCKVYVQYPETRIFKIENPSLSLAESRYSIEQALNCAENYLLNNKNLYKQYQNYQPGTLSPILDSATGSPYHDLTKDWMYYHFMAEVPSDGYIFLNVGTYTCTVYPEYTERLSKLQ